jgi:RNA polymerase-binding transcription factor DksA
METFNRARHMEQLMRRRGQIGMTLRHLRKEHAEVEHNTDWLDQAAYESRVQLLDRLTAWYLAEGREIDEALKRAEENGYGACVACRQPIEGARLQAAPQTKFCAACQEAREALETA